MTKQTVLIERAAHLSLQQGQLECFDKGRQEGRTWPIEDLGCVVLAHPQITCSQALLAALTERNVSIIVCNSRYEPAGMVLPLAFHCLQHTRWGAQLGASAPLQKQLWQRVVREKIFQQACLLSVVDEVASGVLQEMATTVKSGDSTAVEAQAARFYWQVLFPTAFYRCRSGPPPNHALNYGYAVLRAAMARALVGHGLLVVRGIHHHNQYNSFCLADDMMEPYRPFVDEAVYRLWEAGGCQEELTQAERKELAGFLYHSCSFQGKVTSIGYALRKTAASLAACFETKCAQGLLFPTFEKAL